MRQARFSSQFHHTSVESWTGRTLVGSRLSDRDRLAVIMQAAALLSHLETAGGRLTRSWQDLGIDASGVLRGAEVEPGGFGSESAQEMLIDLVEVLYGARDRIIGKGQAKRLAARLLRRWHRTLGRIPADRIVRQILDEAQFLWWPKFSATRRALIAEIPGRQKGSLIVAGRAAFETRVLATNGNRVALEDFVAGPKAGDLWTVCAGGGVSRVAGETSLGCARRAHFAGRWQDALVTLAESQETEARILRADCLRLLGRQGAAKRLLDSRVVGADLSPEENFDLTQVTVAVYLDSGEPGLARSLLAQRPLETNRRCRQGLDLLALEVAARCGDWQTVSRSLSELEDLREEPEWAWRWNRLKVCWTQMRGQLRDAEDLAARNLARGRRRIPQYDVAHLWRELASIRLERGDLAGAERAAGHALRLFESIDESSAVATSRWLADLHLRQGRSIGVESLLRSEGMVPIAARCALDPSPQELRARMDLAGGRPSRSLRRFESCSQQGGARLPERNHRHRVLAARALGWLGRGAEARDLMDGAPDNQRGVLEAEEDPALWALAGDWPRARQSAGNDGVGRLWKLALGNEPISPESWEDMSSLGAYRCARLVFDLQIVVPEKVPRHWLEKAVLTLRRVGAHSFAERLDRTRKGSWQALETFLNSEVDRGRDLGELFTAAGYFDARLEWRRRDVVQILVAGCGGERALRAEKHDGELILSTCSVDPVVRALFALAVREFEPDGDSAIRTPSRVRGILGESDSLHQALVRLERLAESDVPVLIRGETGTGKELAARQLHHLSARNPHRLVTVNCAALSETLLLSDLFGHVRGAFTGADRDRAGVFESAAGGTVLLDEIGDLPLAAQGKLLRVLQEGEVRRVGESLPRQIDIRVVAATHRDLRSMVEEGTFRADLFYRLGVGCLTLPPLRSRERDVLLLAEHFLGASGHSLTARARKRLLSHPWPGNVRELRNVLQVAMALSGGPTIDLADLELPKGAPRSPLGYHQQVEEFRRDLVREALVASGGQRSAAARRLDMSRQAFSYLVRRFGLQ